MAIPFNDETIVFDEGLGYTSGEELGLANKLSEGGAFTTESSGQTLTTLTSAIRAEIAAQSADESEANALASKIAAAASASAAASSESQASSSASSASASASAAASSESNAAESASSALASKGAAAVSETNAANSANTSQAFANVSANHATNAATSASNAATSEANAADSASAASTSASNAATSESNAADSATASANSASASLTSANNSATSASNAATSESNAATSATNAANSESNAANSAIASAASATDSAASATSAASAKAGAEAARDATLAAYDSFDDRYLGAKATAPTVDNDGNPLIAGSLYFDSVLESMRIYTGSAWVAAYVSGTEYVNVSGDSMTGDLLFGDNNIVAFGDSNDLQIFHDGVHSVIRDSGTGSLFLEGTDLQLRNGTSTGTYVACTASDGSVQLRYNNNTKLSTVSNGVYVTGSVTADALALGTNEFITLGNSLYAYGNDNLAVIRADGATDSKLYLQGDEVSITSPFNTETLAKFTLDAGVQLYYDNFVKFETTTTGAAVTGNLQITGDGSIGWANYTFKEEGGFLYVYNGSTKIMRVDSSGNAAFAGNVEANATL